MSSPRVRLLEARVHGRYLVRPAESGQAAPLLMGFHGYGETAEAHLEALEAIPGIRSWHVAAVQGLNRFYTRKGDVVAGWMTRQDRELAIADNVAHVERVLAAVRHELDVAGPVVAGGFSQGTAMAWRAAALAMDPCAGVIALGGDVPPELEGAAWRSRPRALLGRGRTDAWYSTEKLAADLELLGGLGIEARSFEFDGGHEWTEGFRRVAGDFLRQLAC